MKVMCKIIGITGFVMLLLACNNKPTEEKQGIVLIDTKQSIETSLASSATFKISAQEKATPRIMKPEIIKSNDE